MITEEVKDRLITALTQFLSAQASGTSKFTIADAYLAMDNAFTALLLDAGIDPGKNHKVKLNRIVKDFPNVLASAGVSASDLDAFYEAWSGVRYSSAILPPGRTRDFLQQASSIITSITSLIAKRNNLDSEVLSEEIYVAVMGSAAVSFLDEVAVVHEVQQIEAERLGEEGYGTKLGNKLLNLSNFSDVIALADDPITRQILADDDEVGHQVGTLYSEFLRLVNMVGVRRLKRGVEANYATDFSISVRLAFRGMSLEDIAAWFHNILRRTATTETGAQTQQVNRPANVDPA